MSPYVLTPRAKADILVIWSYLAEDNEAAADRVERAIYDACAFVGKAPMGGHSRPDLTARSLRFWTLSRYPNYAVVYRSETTPLQVIAVLHGKRNAQRILRQRTYITSQKGWVLRMRFLPCCPSCKNCP